MANSGLIAKLVEELPGYLQQARSSIVSWYTDPLNFHWRFSGKYGVGDGGTAFDPKVTWVQNNLVGYKFRPVFYRAAFEIVKVLPTTGCVERLWSMLDDRAGKRQGSLLGDILKLSLMYAMNKRN